MGFNPFGYFAHCDIKLLKEQSKACHNILAVLLLFAQPLFPAKIFLRSETVDFQRGEVEWRGGNLYFNKWDYFINVEYMSD